jgi:hypothetical protein
MSLHNRADGVCLNGVVQTRVLVRGILFHCSNTERLQLLLRVLREPLLEQHFVEALSVSCCTRMAVSPSGPLVSGL